LRKPEGPLREKKLNMPKEKSSTRTSRYTTPREKLLRLGRGGRSWKNPLLKKEREKDKKHMLRKNHAREILSIKGRGGKNGRLSQIWGEKKKALLIEKRTRKDQTVLSEKRKSRSVNKQSRTKKGGSSYGLEGDFGRQFLGGEGWAARGKIRLPTRQKGMV